MLVTSQTSFIQWFTAVNAQFPLLNRETSIRMSSRHSGAFVYTGAGKKQDDNADICVKSCRKQACDLQYCLSRNDHKQTRCENYITQWKDCCTQAKEAEVLKYTNSPEACKAGKEQK